MEGNVRYLFAIPPPRNEVVARGNVLRDLDRVHNGIVVKFVARVVCAIGVVGIPKPVEPRQRFGVLQTFWATFVGKSLTLADGWGARWDRVACPLRTGGEGALGEGHPRKGVS